MQADALKYPAVRIAVNDAGKVIAVAVAGRPRPHPFGGYEGSHLTPWSVFVDSVRRAAVGCSVKTAAREVRLLLEQLDTPDGDHAKRLSHPRSTWLNKMIDDGWDVLENARRNGDVSLLQAGIAMYLTGRNLLPMSAAFLGQDKARGRGEPAMLRKLRDYESGVQDFTPRQLRTLMARLLDSDAVTFIATQGDGKTVPGILNDRAKAVRQTVIWHLRELSRAYPLAYDASKLGTTAGCNASFGGITVDGSTKLPETEYEWDAAPAGWSLSSSNACLANIELEIRSKVNYVGELHLEGRGNTLLNTQGHHVTAHIAIEAAVHRTVVDVPIPQALTQMLALAENIEKLALWPSKAPGADIDPTGIFANALVNFVAAKDGAKTALTEAADDVDMVPELEGLIGAYIMMRNALPMAAVLRGATADAKAEGHKMAKLRAWDEDQANAERGLVCWTLWKMLDLQALNALGEMDDGRTHEWAPGAPATPDERVARVLSTHLDTMATAFPALFKLSYMRTESSVAWVLSEANLPVAGNLSQTLGLGKGAVKPVSPFKSHAKKADDDAEWGQLKRRGTK